MHALGPTREPKQAPDRWLAASGRPLFDADQGCSHQRKDEQGQALRCLGELVERRLPRFWKLSAKHRLK